MNEHRSLTFTPSLVCSYFIKLFSLRVRISVLNITFYKLIDIDEFFCENPNTDYCTYVVIIVPRVCEKKARMGAADWSTAPSLGAVTKLRKAIAVPSPPLHRMEQLGFH
jgi:hypothetical protein